MTGEQRDQLIELIDDWDAEALLNAAIGILARLTPEDLISFGDRERLIAMAKVPCDMLLLNLVEKDGRIGLIGTAAIMYLLDVLRQWVMSEQEKARGDA